MRKYPKNSPQAAARIIALTVVADRDVHEAEFTLLDQLGVHAQLGLEREELHAIFDNFCADLLAYKQLTWSGICPVDEYTLGKLMQEIDAPQLRRLVLDLCVQIAEVDGQVMEGESIVLLAAAEHWGMSLNFH